MAAHDHRREAKSDPGAALHQPRSNPHSVGQVGNLPYVARGDYGSLERIDGV